MISIEKYFNNDSNYFLCCSGHAICQSCVGLTDRMQIRCKLCSEINRVNLDDLNESKAAKQLIKVHFDQLFHIIQDRFEASLDQLKGVI